MPAVSPTRDLAARLQPFTLPAAGGGLVTLGDLWADGTVVLVHLRHFG
jgi:hypothetical protein